MTAIAKKDAALKSLRTVVRGGAILMAYLGGQHVVNEQDAMKHIDTLDATFNVLIPSVMWLTAEFVGWWVWLKGKFSAAKP